MSECIKLTCARPATRRGMCNSCYGTYSTRQKAYGRWETLYTDAEPVRTHVRNLQAVGLGLRRIAELAGVHRSQLTSLLNGRPHRGTGPSRQVNRDLAAKILAVPVPDIPHRLAADRHRIPGIGTTRRLQALVAFGYTQSDLCSRLGMSATNGTCLFSGTRGLVTATTARKIEALFDALQLIPGPSDRARQRAARRGWAPPLAWDEDTIDNPDARPDRGQDLKGGFLERYQELVDLGVGQIECARRMGITFRSLQRQLHRHGIAVSPQLQDLDHKQRKAG
ncbi:MAG TPA: hypothetical protein PLF91_06175 [Mycolicibacterium fallax]|nr:hypothetical protein [Mycolicibacterium fallax]